MQNLKVVVSGDGAAGKTSLLITYMTKKFPWKYVPTTANNHIAEVTQNGKRYNMALWDTAGGEDYERMRPLSYPQTDVFLLCFDVADQASLSNIPDYWLPELRYHAPEVPIILVANKTDLRPSKPYIDFDEGYKVAKDNHLYYAETSALIHHGLKELFELVVDVVCQTGPEVARLRRMKKVPHISLPIPPALPLVERTSGVEVEDSKYADHMASALQDQQSTDVIFVVEGVKEVKCHKVILCSACNYFCQVFGISASVEQDEAEIPFKFTWSDINEGKVAGLSSIADVGNDDGRHVTKIAVSNDISSNVFSLLLDFLYTGLPKLDEGVQIDAFILNELRRVAKIFFLPCLIQVVQNRENDEDILNPNPIIDIDGVLINPTPSIGTYLNERMGQRAKALFLGKETFSDIKFNVQGSVIPAHKVILMSRCDVMSRMFGGSFTESSTEEVTIHDEDQTNFQALLEYLYTDRAPLEEGDRMGILKLADRYGQERLRNLCELYIVKDIEKAVRDDVAEAEIDVIEVLRAAQFHNAKKLANWCFHLISTNYITFSKRSEFIQLDGDNLEYITKNRWPPVSYLEEIKEYEALIAMDEHDQKDRVDVRKDKKCDIM